jgi:15-cis-phytoene synthase
MLLSGDSPAWDGDLNDPRLAPAPPTDGVIVGLARPAAKREVAAALARSEADLSVAEAYECCRRVAREIARTFYYGSLFLPREKRRAAWALYAFCRMADDMADEPALFPQPLAALRSWRAALYDAYAGRPRGPVMLAWADVLRRFPVPIAPALELLDGVEMDVRGVCYDTFEELRGYCYRVAGTVGLLMTPVLGHTPGVCDEATACAADLGIAMQLTNILRDLGEDAARGRVYLPAEDLARFGYAREELLAGVRNPAFARLMQFEIARAEEYYARGLGGVCLLDADSRLAIALSGALYRAILDRIRRNGYDSFTRRAHVSTAAKLAAIPPTWLRLRQGM